MHHARSGELLKEIQVGTGILAGPMTYAVGDTQYVAVTAGFADVLSEKDAGAIQAYVISQQRALRQEK